ncbi:hypothetical protein GCM10009712_17310 [Pseudarthrobacter sulfonivorans]
MNSVTGQEDGCSDCDEGPYLFDEQGQIIDNPFPGTRGQADLPAVRASRQRPCSLGALNGSWLIELTARGGDPSGQDPIIRGPMRIQVGASSLRISGDVYVRRGQDPTDRGLRPGPLDEFPNGFASGGPAGVAGQDTTDTAAGRWYPQLPLNEYSWYFRSNGVSYASALLGFGFVRHIWDRTTQDFISTDVGEMRLTCRQSLINLPHQPARMSGTAAIGGRVYDVKATKTSNFFRGCRVEVDAMSNRVWPASAITGAGVTTTFQNVYASAGWDVGLTVDEVDVPEDASLTIAELQTLISTHRGAGSVDEWRLWLLSGSSQGTLFGIMFDQDQVPREGAVGFADATLGDGPTIEASARNKPLDEVPAAFLRTLVHEAGHAFNLFHPKHDVHNPPIGTEIMNQTGDVMGFATVANPYPRTATFGFAEHDRISLVHAPDPQVRPGWKPFGWGHGSLSSGLPEPTDAAGLVNADDAVGMVLELKLPEEVYVGEYVVAEVTLRNVGDEPRETSKHLNLAEGDLRLLHALPTGQIEQVLDIVVACGPRETTVLQPGQSLTSLMQVFFTSEGVTFQEPGVHVVRAEFDLGGRTSVRSTRSTVRVRMAGSGEERDIAGATLDRGVSTALALGDFGRDDNARRRLAAVAEAHHEHDTGAACALVLANSLARQHVDYRRADTRAAEPGDAKHFLDLAMQGRSAAQVVELAVTVACPVERDAPVVAEALSHGKRARKPQDDLDRAGSIAQDFVENLPR